MKRTIEIPAAAGTFVAGDGLSTTVARRAVFTAVSWTATKVVTTANPTASVAGDLIFNADDGAWGIVTSSTTSPNEVNVKRWYRPGSGNSGFIPAGTTASGIYIFPKSYISSSRASLICGIHGFIGTSIDIFGAQGNALFQGATGNFPDLDIPVRGPWYVVTVGGTHEGTIVFETSGSVET